MNNLNILAAMTFIASLWAIPASAVPIGLTKLTGLTGGSPQGTAVFRSDLSSVGLGDVLSITIQDNSFGLGGASGQFSGFDMDAIILSNALCTSAGCVASLTGLSVFDYSPAGTLFTPGSQRVPTDPKLFGTDATGFNVDNSIASLGIFDANSAASIPPADGFVSMGDGGLLSFNLSSAVSTAGLYLYFGEVGDNGEAAAANISISDTTVTVPEPSIFALLTVGLAGLVLSRKKINIVQPSMV